MRRADQDVVEPIAIDVADRRDGIAAEVAHTRRLATFDTDRLGRVCIGEPGLAEDDVSGAVLAVIVWRGDHEITDAVAVEVASIRDGVAGLRIPGIACTELDVEYG